MTNKLRSIHLIIFSFSFSFGLFSQDTGNTDRGGIATLITDSLGNIIDYKRDRFGKDYGLIHWAEKMNFKDGVDTIKALHYSKQQTVIRHVNDYIKTKVEVFDSLKNLVRISYFDSVDQTKSMEWYSNGVPRYTYTKKAGITTQINYDERGLVYDIHLHDESNNQLLAGLGFDSIGQITGITQYEPRDSVIHTIIYEKDTGHVVQDYYMGNKLTPYKEYYSNGQIWVEGQLFVMHDNCKGTWRHYYANGKIEREYHYDTTLIIRYPKLKIGTWSWWDEQGNLIKQELYENGELKETKEYLPGGKVKGE